MFAPTTAATAAAVLLHRMWRRGSSSSTKTALADTDAPALAEYLDMQRLGMGGSSCAYITVGTGIGVGLVVNGKPVHGLMHPEGGHVCVPRLPSDATYEGSNPTDCFGGACAENMACSLSLAKRSGLPDTSHLVGLPDTHAAWDAAGHYLGAMCASLVLLVSPERIVLSGGVLDLEQLLELLALDGAVRET